MNLIFNETAFKHGVTVKDINCAMAVPLADILLEKYLNEVVTRWYQLPVFLESKKGVEKCVMRRGGFWHSCFL
jgi:hypothetical protein